MRDQPVTGLHPPVDMCQRSERGNNEQVLRDLLGTYYALQPESGLRLNALLRPIQSTVIIRKDHFSQSRTTCGDSAGVFAA